jgi:hypothetical protein
VDVYTPYAVHGLDHAMGLPPSRLGRLCFLFGLIGVGVALWFQFWASAVDWPINVGGRPWNSWPAFVPVAFELMVLFGALSTVAGLFINARLPRARMQVVYDPDFSQGHFGVYVTANGRADEARRIMKDAGATDVRERAEEVRRDI